MAVKRVIPCLDVQAGRVVKGVNFRSLQDMGDPVEHARFYAKSGADELIFLDIAATVAGISVLPETIGQVAAVLSIPLAVGGGIKSLEDIRILLGVGATKIALGTAALGDPRLVEKAALTFGSDKIMVAVDCRRVSPSPGHPDWEVYSRGGRTPTGIDVISWVQRLYELGAGEILLTSMDGDGTLDGYDNELNRAVSQAVPIPIIASGGAGQLEHFRDAFLVGGVDAILAASVFHRQIYSIHEVKAYLQRQGIPVRL